MSAPWLSPTDFRKNGMSNAYLRMMNTSGMAFRDHAGSMVRLLSISLWSASLFSYPSYSSFHPFPKVD